MSAPEKIRNTFIFSLRRLDPSKGVDLTIEALASIKDDFPDLYLVIAGEGPEENYLKELVEKKSLSDRVLFLGTVPLSRGISLLKGATLTVVPSRSEGGGLINIEAQAAGCPVIASRVGGIPEYVSDGESGILFESGNAKELAEKIKEILTDRRLRGKLIKGGFKHAERFSWDILAPRYMALYKDAIVGHNKNIAFTPWSNLTAALWERLNHRLS